VPTARGWLVAATGIAVTVVGALLGTGAVEQIGVALVVLVAVAVGVVRLSHHDIEVTRRVSPHRASPGRPVTVTLDLDNLGRGAAPLMLLEDRLPRGLGGRSRFALAGLEPRGRRTMSYEVRPARRGRYVIGPTKMSFVDPFGLASRRGLAVAESVIVIHPFVERLVMPRDTGERRSLASSALRQPTGATGEEFYTLREYTEGDDLRKIHWPSTAKRGKYMIRQEETPWHTRATVVIDDRAAPYEASDTAFERAVEAAAALVNLWNRSGYSYRLTGGHNPGLPTGKGSEAFHHALDLLATLALHPPSRSPGEADALLGRLVSLEAGAGPEGTLVVVTGTPSSQVALAVARCRKRFRSVTVICFPGHRFGSAPTKDRWDGERVTNEAVALMSRSGIRPIVMGPSEALGSAWASATAGRARGGEPDWAQRPELV
jgi:uncharacterized protein (DUF58 family)